MLSSHAEIRGHINIDIMQNSLSFPYKYLKICFIKVMVKKRSKSVKTVSFIHLDIDGSWPKHAS